MDNYKKIKLLVFDCDGVLVSSRELHFHALNRALEKINPKYIITEQEHASSYDGNPTSVKLNMLTKEKGLPVEEHSKIWKLKQEFTQKLIEEGFTYDERLRQVLKRLKEEGYMIYCASNAIWSTISLMLSKKGLIEYFDYFTSAEGCRPKPHPDIYLNCILRAKVSPRETLIMEVRSIYKQDHKYITTTHKYVKINTMNTHRRHIIDKYAYVHKYKQIYNNHKLCYKYIIHSFLGF